MCSCNSPEINKNASSPSNVSNNHLEYTALRAEIITWIQIEYSLIVAAVTIEMIALGFFKKTDYWALYSAVLLGLLGSVSALVSFARAKINQTSAYLIVFFENAWERRMYDLTVGGGIRLTTSLHKGATFVLFTLLGFAAIAYPYVESTGHDNYPWFGWVALTTSTIWYSVTFTFWWLSYDKKGQVEYWTKEKATHTTGAH